MKKEYKIKTIIVIFGIIFGISCITFELFTTLLASRNNFDDKLKASGSWNLPPLFINGSGTGVGAHNWSWVEDQIWFGGGNGTWNNPYIIENITIDALNSGTCFEIVDSNKCFILRTCIFVDSGSSPTSDAGLKMDNVNNSKIMDNRIFNNRGNGILLISSNNNTIFNNEVKDNDYRGMDAQYSVYNNISNNVFQNNVDSAVHMLYCDHSTFVNNTVDLNWEEGIRALYCEYSLFSYNSFSKNGFHLLGNGMYSGHCSHSNFSNNFFNQNTHDGVVIDDAYNITVLHNEMIGNYLTGFNLYEVHESFIFNNTVVYNNGYGIHLSTCENNEITENLFNYNFDDGMSLSYCNNNTIQHNEVMHNDQNGIELYRDCDMNNITSNSINHNHLYGLYLRRSDNNSIIENNLIGNENCIYEINCIGNIFIDNICNRTNKIFIEILNQVFSSEEFNITFYIFNVNHSGLIVDSILMWWNSIEVSSSVQNLGGGLYFVSLEPITVAPGDDPILLDMTISADGYEDKYFEAYFAVDPDVIDKGIPETEAPAIPGYNIILLISLISILLVIIKKKRIIK